MINRLSVQDFSKHPVWAYYENDASKRDDRCVRPVLDLPVKSLMGCLVGTQILLANGVAKWAVLSNITVTNQRKSKHFLTVWIEDHGEWFELARYFDVDYKRRGPEQLARFLGMRQDEVFSIAYDITAAVQGGFPVLRGRIEADPEEKLTEDEIIALTLADD